jgi:hypothetical protein
MNQEFAVHKLNAKGIGLAEGIAKIFDDTLNQLSTYCAAGREYAIVKTKLEEACFFAKKAMAADPLNQL